MNKTTAGNSLMSLNKQHNRMSPIVLNNSWNNNDSLQNYRRMRELFAVVLNEKDLSKAGELFSLDDREIEPDLTEVLERIGQIVDSNDYVTSSNDQSVVEICVTRVLSAIRETECIMNHLSALISLLEVCLRYDLRPSGKDEDPAHAKIASDILSNLFMNYNKKGVMQMTLPVVVRFLDCENKELIRNVSSYLSLAAISYPSMLVTYTEIIVSSILKGNSSLTQLLPNMYSENKQAILDRVPELAHLMDTKEVQERLNLILLFTTIAKENPQLLQPHVPVFCDYLKKSDSMTPHALSILVDIAAVNPRSLVAYVSNLQTLASNYPIYTEQVTAIIGSIGTISENDAKRSIEYLVSLLPNADKNTVQFVLSGLRKVATSFPHLLNQYLPEINKHCQNKSHISDLHKLCEDLKRRSTTLPETEDLRKKFVSFEGEELRKKFVTFSEGDIHLSGSTPEKEVRSVSSQTEGTVTVITVGNPPNATCPSDTVSVKHTVIAPLTSSQLSLGKGSRRSSSNSQLPHGRPTSPCSLITASDIPNSTSLTSTGTSPSCPSPVSSMKELDRDAVQHFCEKHLGKIKVFVTNVSARVPLPAKCSVVNGRHKRFVKLNFLCGSHHGDECLYSNNNYFMLATRIPKTWIHLMFLALQAKASSALSQQDACVSRLKNCWDALKSDKGASSFLTVVTSSFPSAKDQDALLHELHNVRYFDVFEFNATEHHWACFMCNHPEKMLTLLQDGNPVISGQLKEKKGRWKFLKRWKTRYFSLSGANITYSKSDSRKETLPVSKIQSVKAVRKGLRDIPRAFEIFTGDQTYVLKAKDQQNVEQWVQCLQIAVARSQKKEPLPYRSPDADSHQH